MRWPSVIGSLVLVVTGMGAVWTASSAASVAQVPSSCSALQPDVTKYLANVSADKLEGAVVGAMVCDFTFADGAPKTVIQLIAHSSKAEVGEAALYAHVNGYAVELVPHLGKFAFSIARNHEPWGVAALSTSDVYYLIKGHFSFAKDIALVRALFQQN